MFDELLSPINPALFYDIDNSHPRHLYHRFSFNEGKKIILTDCQLAVLGITDDRGAIANPGCGESVDAIRRELYTLFTPESAEKLSFIDLGNLRSGQTQADTYAALAAVVIHCITRKTVLIIIGGGHDHSIGQFKGYQELMSLVNMVVVDEHIDLMQKEQEFTHHRNFLTPILLHNPNFLFHYTHLGYQTYLNDYQKSASLEGLNFDCHRLGLVRAQLEETEPYFRDADLVSIDISAVKMSDAPGVKKPTPHGFAGEELCQMSRFAGLSDKLTTIGFYEVNPSADFRNQTIQLTAQAVWYFIEGFSQRQADNPAIPENFYRFSVRLEQVDHELIFWKSKRTERWWMEMPYVEDERFRRHRMIPCSASDYELACQEEIPDRWMRIWSKMNN